MEKSRCEIPYRQSGDELRVASFEIPRRIEVAGADRRSIATTSGVTQGLNHQNGDRDAVGAPLLVREVVGVAERSVEGRCPRERTTPIDRNRSSARRWSSFRRRYALSADVDAVRYRKRPVHFK
jgi:hypothetical protein